MNKLKTSGKIELLSPAKNLDFGKEAINHGADAVYIGAPKFSARQAASNTIEDIEILTGYAHKFGAKVHVALNTILSDHELDDTQKIIFQLYQAGVDALIIQDMGILTLDLPPIELHASTQMDNRSVDKIQLLENLGFDRVVLARELSIHEIQEIKNQTNIELEAFVHGALCVSYSGQCYISQAFTGRSANKGMCAQLCRLPYSLKDQNGKWIRKDQYLLSLKDMDRSSSLLEIIGAGITSLKIEGRLKDLSYVKNITGYYRKKLDAIFENKSNFVPASFGKTTLFFDPQPSRTFHRDKTEYFLHERDHVETEINTPKSIGEKVGVVESVERDHLQYSGITLSNGDGVIFTTKNGHIEGFRINRTDGNKIFPASKVEIEPGTILFRNFNQVFEKKLEKKSAERKIRIQMNWKEVPNGFELSVKDERGCSVSQIMKIEKTISLQSQNVKDQLISILQKMGNTIYVPDSIEIQMDNHYFIPASLATLLRRSVLNQLDDQWMEKNKPNQKSQKTTQPFSIKLKEHLSYLSNVMNNGSKRIYFDLGVKKIDDAFEIQEPEEDVLLMQCKHCIKYALGYCPKGSSAPNKIPFKEPFILEHQKIKLMLQFDCQSCVMLVYRQDRKR